MKQIRLEPPGGEMIISRIVRAVVLSVFLCAGAFLSPALAGDYSELYGPSDGDWLGSKNDSTNGVATASAYSDPTVGDIHVSCSAGIPGGEGNSRAWVYKEFTFSHPSHSTYIHASYTIDGAGTRTPNGLSRIQVKAELHDVTGGSYTLLHTRYGKNQKSLQGELHGYPDIVFSHVLEQGRKYRVTVTARAYCLVDDPDIGSVSLSFNSEPQYSINAYSLWVVHEHDWVGTQGGQSTVHHADAEWDLKQTDYDEADELTLYIKADPAPNDYLAGWWVGFSDFDRAGNERTNDTKARAWAWAQDIENVLRDEWTIVKTRLYFDEDPGCSNIIGKENDRFWPASSGVVASALPEGQVVPDHTWWILNPEEVPGQPGIYAHSFFLQNTDLLEPLDIQSLTLLATTDQYDTLSEVDFADPEADVLDTILTVGSPPLQIDVLTEGEFEDGTIYLAYNVAVDGEVVSHAWGGHPVPEPAHALMLVVGTGVLSILERARRRHGIGRH